MAPKRPTQAKSDRKTTRSTRANQSSASRAAQFQATEQHSTAQSSQASSTQRRARHPRAAHSRQGVTKPSQEKLDKKGIGAQAVARKSHKRKKDLAASEQLSPSTSQLPEASGQPALTGASPTAASQPIRTDLQVSDQLIEPTAPESSIAKPTQNEATEGQTITGHDPRVASTSGPTAAEQQATSGSIRTTIRLDLFQGSYTQEVKINALETTTQKAAEAQKAQQTADARGSPSSPSSGDDHPRDLSKSPKKRPSPDANGHGGKAKKLRSDNGDSRSLHGEGDEVTRDLSVHGELGTEKAISDGSGNTDSGISRETLVSKKVPSSQISRRHPDDDDDDDAGNDDDEEEHDDDDPYYRFSDWYRARRKRGDAREQELRAADAALAAKLGRKLYDREQNSIQERAEPNVLLWEQTATRAIFAVTQAIANQPGGVQFSHISPENLAYPAEFLGPMPVTRPGNTLLVTHSSQPEATSSGDERSYMDVLKAVGQHTSLLSLAREVDHSGIAIPSRFTIHHYDSLGGENNMHTSDALAIAQRLEKKLRNSAWNRDGQASITVTSKEQVRGQDPALLQTGTWECGFFATFRAWAIALGLPPAKLQHSTPQVLPKSASNMINLALLGKLDSRTIEGFLKLYNFADRSAKVPADRHFSHTVHMETEVTLERLIRQMEVKQVQLSSLSHDLDAAQSVDVGDGGITLNDLTTLEDRIDYWTAEARKSVMKSQAKQSDVYSSMIQLSDRQKARRKRARRRLSPDEKAAAYGIECPALVYETLPSARVVSAITAVTEAIVQDPGHRQSSFTTGYQLLRLSRYVAAVQEDEESEFRHPPRWIAKPGHQIFFPFVHADIGVVQQIALLAVLLHPDDDLYRMYLLNPGLVIQEESAARVAQDLALQLNAAEWAGSPSTSMEISHDLAGNYPYLEQDSADDKWDSPFLTIFTAWAIALGLTPSPPYTQKSFLSPRVLQRDSAIIINLVLKGMMDSKTIAMFLVDNGFVNHSDLLLDSEPVFERTVPFPTEAAFERYLENFRLGEVRQELATAFTQTYGAAPQEDILIAVGRLVRQAEGVEEEEDGEELNDDDVAIWTLRKFEANSTSIFAAYSTHRDSDTL